MAQSNDDNSDEEWEDDPSGFGDALSQHLDNIESIKLSPDAKPPSSSQSSDDVVVIDGESTVNKAFATHKTPESDPAAEAATISGTECVIDPRLDELDPNPDIIKLLRIFDERFFDGVLRKNKVTVSWSRHMTLSAGKCEYYPKEKRCMIKISIPLVREAPRKNRVETLLHEMIHAYLFVTGEEEGHEEHGPLFTNHMARINTLGKCYITLKHTFDVKWRFWQCNGKCAKKPPYFGRIQRSNDRPPGPEDWWFQRHQEDCDGQFEKVTETRAKPADNATRVKDKKGKKSKANTAAVGLRDIRHFYPIVNKPIRSPKLFNKPSPKSSSKITSDKKDIDPEVIVLD